MKLRAACADDALAMAQVHATAFPQGWSAQEIGQLVAGLGGFAILVEAAGPLGFILCRTVAGEAEVLTLAVDPVARRQGLAFTLVEAARGAAQQAGAESLFLEVAADNPAALALYEKAGFDRVGLRKGYYARSPNRPVDAIVMRLDLGPSTAALYPDVT